ncbi:uncharacterized protein TNCV_2897061 [Trichonephila clavipes]|nr:uncharacterized protein TNCV_2897061 [Trichonephila clavipes]
MEMECVIEAMEKLTVSQHPPKKRTEFFKVKRQRKVRKSKNRKHNKNMCTSIIRVHVPPSGEETGHQNYIVAIARRKREVYLDLPTKSAVEAVEEGDGKPVPTLDVAFLGFWTVKTVLNPISGQFFDEGHGESGVLRSAEWHDGDWLDDGIREAWLLCFVRMVDFQKF